MQNNKIIIAISSPPGVGGIALIRLSGEGAIALVDTVFESPNKKKLIDQKANTIHFGLIKNDDTILDEVLVSIFKAPHSFTGEESVEISCHGSIYIQQHILQLLVDRGAFLAQPGEFTQRAFLNGKMDLSQAESVADLIASSSSSTHRLAMNQMRGGFSDELMKVRTELLNFTSLIELELDFSEEDVVFANREHLKNALENIETHIRKLSDSFTLGNAVKNGIPVAIIGETNAGKSTLLNLLLHEEKAIVSDIHGTTRDVIEDVINIHGLSFRLIDTAGIRETSDEIESIGIERTFKKIEQANIILWVIDAAMPEGHIVELYEKILPLITHQQLVLVFNKMDKMACDSDSCIHMNVLQEEVLNRVFISAKKEEGMDSLLNKIVEMANIPTISEQDIIVTNVRHYESLQKALASIERVNEGLDLELSGDFLSQDIRECMYYLGEITGQISTDEILGNIFSKFCIGK